MRATAIRNTLVCSGRPAKHPPVQRNGRRTTAPGGLAMATAQPLYHAPAFEPTVDEIATLKQLEMGQAISCPTRSSTTCPGACWIGPISARRPGASSTSPTWAGSSSSAKTTEPGHRCGADSPPSYTASRACEGTLRPPRQTPDGCASQLRCHAQAARAGLLGSHCGSPGARSGPNAVAACVARVAFSYRRPAACG